MKQRFDARIDRLVVLVMDLMDSVRCGPDDRSCDLGRPCPAHGGEYDDETAADTVARMEWEQRFSEIK